MNSMFYDCPKLKHLPDLSKWNIKNIINRNEILIIYDNIDKTQK